MQWADNIRRIKLGLIVAAILIAIGSLVVSGYLARDLSREEQNKMQVWAEAMRSLSSADENVDMNLVLTVINGNNTIPVIVTNSRGGIDSFRNIELGAEADTLGLLMKKVAQMRAAGNLIRIDLSAYAEGEFIDICYADSLLLTRLAWYPYVQLVVVLIFVLICIVALLSSKRAEQNRVWVGLSKETAHQLGTPISSLMAWMELLKDKHPDDPLLPDMEKDVKRLQLIADRFSKIGSLPELQPQELTAVTDRVVEYIKHRTSNRVTFTVRYPKQPVFARINAPLFEWVIENLFKNAIDAMQGQGGITLTVSQQPDRVLIEVSDTGKGIPRSHYKTVFSPGFTTKKRGWGLGLSLAKRIVEEYHRGRIYVKHSEVGKGTIFQIELKK